MGERLFPERSIGAGISRVTGITRQAAVEDRDFARLSGQLECLVAAGLDLTGHARGLRAISVDDLDVRDSAARVNHPPHYDTLDRSQERDARSLCLIRWS